MVYATSFVSHFRYIPKKSSSQSGDVNGIYIDLPHRKLTGKKMQIPNIGGTVARK